MQACGVNGRRTWLLALVTALLVLRADAATEATDPDNVFVATTRQGLVIRAENAYWPSRDWRALVERLGQASPQTLEQVFGLEVAAMLVPQVSDMHVRVSAALVRRLRHSDLREVDWGRRSVLHLRVTELSLRLQGGAEREMVATLRTEAALLDSAGRVAAHREWAAVAMRRGEAPIKLGFLVRDAVDGLYAMLRTAAPELAIGMADSVAVAGLSSARTAAAATLVRRAREQYGRIRTGDGWAHLERRRAGRDGKMHLLVRRDDRIVFDAARAQVQYRQVSTFPGQAPQTSYKGQYFVDDWRRSSSDSTRGAATSPGSAPPADLLSALPVHHRGLLPKSPLTLLEEALGRGELEIVGEEPCDGLMCQVLDGTMFTEADGMTYDLRFWLAAERGYLPVRVSTPLLGLQVGSVTTFEYREAEPGVWMPTRVLSRFRAGDAVVTEHEMVYEDTFRVNGPTPPRLTEAINLIVDEAMWDR